jgi:hypothetical protein
LLGSALIHLRSVIRLRLLKSRNNIKTHVTKDGTRYEYSEDGIPCGRCNKTMYTGWSNINDNLVCSSCAIKLASVKSNAPGERHYGKAEYRHPSRKQIADKYIVKENI